MLKATLKSLVGRRLRLLMSTFAVVLGVAFVAGSFIFTDTLGRSFDSIFASAVGDVIVRAEGGTGPDGAPTTKTVPGSLVEDLALVDGAARADGNVFAVGVYVVGENGKLVGGFGAPAMGVNLTDAPAGHGLEGLVVLEGEAPQGPGEVAIDEATAEKAGYEVGDTVQLALSTDDPVLRPKLVGVVGYREGGSLNGANMTVFDTATAQELFLGGAFEYNDVWVTAGDGVSQEELRAEIEKILPAGFEAVTGDEEVEKIGNSLQEATSFLNTFLLVFAFIALVVGVFLIVNTFAMLVAQRMREMALLRALGASRRQVSGSVVLEAAILGLIGGVLGLALGILLAKGIVFAFAQFGLDLSAQTTIIAPRTVVVSIVVGVVTTLIAVWMPARRAGKVAPIEALRADATVPETSLRRWSLIGAVLAALGLGAMLSGLYLVDDNAAWYVGAGIFAMLLGVTAISPALSRPFASLFGLLYKRTSGVVGNIATENAKRNPRRTAVTASALMLGLALVTTIATMGTSAKQSIADSLEESFAGDLVVSNAVGTSFSTKVGDIAADIEGVDIVSRIRYVFLGATGTELLPAIDPDTIGSVVDVEFDEGSFADLGQGGVALLADYADEEGLQVGDTLTLDLPTGEHSFPVEAIYEPNTIIGFDYLISLDTMGALGYPAADNVVYLTVADGYETADIQKELEDATVDLPMVTVKDQQGYVEEQQGLFNQMLTMVYGLLGLAIIIAILGIVNTLALSVIERTREVGLLRAIGLDRRQLRRTIRLEAIVISVYGAVLGVSMGLLFGSVLINSLADQGLNSLVIPWGQVIAFVVAAAVVGVLAAVFPARRAAKLDVLQAITTE
jgi:putative ABC transport system permease protein